MTIEMGDAATKEVGAQQNVYKIIQTKQNSILT